MAKIVSYLLMDGKKIHREIKVDISSDHITGVMALADASAYAVNNPDKKVSLEIVVAE